ncbi:hypothetical protein DPMN_053066 [Dreissena polymorpha]|uniref:Uncharacterized protein n=1 Tax=Dreissena polymorpha TaxID=45954 RepID=A0A9D4CKP6_DREPO|nr:hypothetical protein DPMN_053066 [Dreissena polymorpha]
MCLWTCSYLHHRGARVSVVDHSGQKNNAVPRAATRRSFHPATSLHQRYRTRTNISSKRSSVRRLPIARVNRRECSSALWHSRASNNHNAQDARGFRPQDFNVDCQPVAQSLTRRNL